MLHDNLASDLVDLIRWRQNMGAPEGCVRAANNCVPRAGYDVTMVKDATASFTEEQMQAALRINLPNYANAMVTTEQIVGSIAFLKPLGARA